MTTHHHRPVLDHLVDPDECALWAPFETLPIVEPLPPAMRIDFPSHAEFMEARNQRGWLAWQLTRPLRTPATVARVARDPKGRFTRKGPRR